MISIKEYARINNVSYEAVRQQVARYREDLGEHVVKDGRQQFLDDVAVAFLDERRQKNPVVMYQADKDEELERLREECQRLLEELNGAKNRIIAQQDRLYELAASEQKMLLLEATSKAAEERADQAEERACAAEQKAEESEKQAISAVQRKLEAELALEESREREKTAEQIAEAAGQEAERAKADAAELQAKLDRLADAGWLERRRILRDLKKGKCDAPSEKIENSENC